MVYAHLPSSPHHEEARGWLEDVVDGPTRIGFPWLTLLAFVRLMGNAHVVGRPRPPRQSWQRVEQLLQLPHAWIPSPTERHRELLGNLLDGESRADIANDAHLAALAIEHGLTVCSTDRDFSRFPGVRWENPLAP